MRLAQKFRRLAESARTTLKALTNRIPQDHLHFRVN